MKREKGERLYGLVYHLIRRPVELLFRFRHQVDRDKSPTFIICNHVTNYDPILVALSFPGRRIHFVASEHLFRKGLLSRLLNYVFAPISRRKGVSGSDTAMACLRKLKAGKSVCLFAEGETTWDGVTAEIFSATGRLAQMSGARLLTYRLEGGYLTAPRWGKGIRRGAMAGRIAGVYAPEQLKQMSREEVTQAICRDIYEDAWQRQKQAPVAYGRRRRAEHLETVLFRCPHCGGDGTLGSRGNFLFCQCGKKWEYTAFGTFSPAEPFENVGQWDAWQRQELEKQENIRFSMENVSVLALVDDHGQQHLADGTLELREGILRCGVLEFPLTEISNMALVQSRILLLSVGSRYFELKAKKPGCLRKFLLAWRNVAGVAQTV